MDGVVSDEPTLSHVDAGGSARMVDVGDKSVTRRRAVAEGRVRASAALLDAISQDTVKKGNVLETARLAGIQAAKETSRLVPLCHPLPLDVVDVDCHVDEPFVRITATAQATAKTGVEMEALTAVSVAALTVIDMGKAIDPGMVIEGIRLIEKTGGTSGDYRADG
jgi:cyclic pyranopterin phosphate synthase